MGGKRQKLGDSDCLNKVFESVQIEIKVKEIVERKIL